jgi:cytochrome c-type biogenesis protein CcmH/NrfG
MVVAAVAGALSAVTVLVLARPLLGTGRGSRVGVRLRRLLVLVVAVAASLGVSGLLVGSTTARSPLTQERSTAPDATAAARAAVDAAVGRAAEEVRRHPGRVSAHLALARAYAAAGRAQLATVEFLAVTRLQPGNAEANTALALVAFTSGSPGSAKRLADLALRTDPGYPEALYTRGLVNAMGLHRADAARRDLHAYLRAAPFGSHRTTAETVLALLDGRGRR